VPLVFVEIDAFNERNEGAFYFIQGIVHKLCGEFEESEKKLLAALEAGYDEKELRFQLTDLYLKTNMYIKAKEQIAALKRLGSISWSNHEIESRIHHRLRKHSNNLLQDLHKRFLKELEGGKIEQSIETLEKALDINEQSIVINHNLALLYFDRGELEKAEIYCARSLWFEEDNPKNHDLMGNIYFNQAVFEKALSEFKRIVEIDERDARAHFNIGSTYYSLEDWPNAEKYWKRAIEYEEKKVKKRRESQSRKKDFAYFLIVKRSPISFLAHKSLGKLYLEQNLIDKAISALERAIDIHPDKAEPYLDLAKAYYEKEQDKKAVSYLQKYLYLGGREEEEANKLLDKIKKRKKRNWARKIDHSFNNSFYPI
jgi:tetratricopeptide (TPR) repeat protein